MKGRRGGRRGKEGEVARGCCLGFSKGEGEGAAASSLPCRRLSWWATTRKDETGFILQKADLGICILFLSSCKKARLLFFLPLEKRKKKSGRKNLPRLSSPVARAPALFDALRPFVRRRMQLSVTFISIGTRESVQRSRNTIAYHTWPTKNTSPQKASPPLAGEPSHVSGCVLTKKKKEKN